MDLLSVCGIHPKPRYTLRDRGDILSRIALHDLILSVNAEIHQFMEGLKLYGVLQMMQHNPEGGRLLMCHSEVWHTTPQEFLDSLQQPEYSAEGSNLRKVEVDVFTYLVQFLEDLSSEGKVRRHITFSRQLKCRLYICINLDLNCQHSNVCLQMFLFFKLHQFQSILNP